MTLRVLPVTTTVEAAPGEVVGVPIRLSNPGDTPSSFTATVVGLDLSTDGAGANATGVTAVVPPLSDADLIVPVTVPASLGVGDHAAAVEIRTDRAGERPMLVPFSLLIASVARVGLSPHPSTIRGRRRAKFQLDIVNNEAAPVDLTLAAEAQDVRVRFRDTRVQLLPGGRVRTSAKLKGPRHWSGENTQHNVVITARGRGAATTVTAAYVQEPLFAHRARMLVAALVVIALWVGAIGAVALWWQDRQDESAQDGEYTGRDTDGDGVDDTFVNAAGSVIHGIDNDGDGVIDAFVDEDGNPVADPTGGAGSGGSGGDAQAAGTGTGDDSGSDDGTGTAGAPSTVLRGTVSAGDDLSGISIKLTPIALGAAPKPAAMIHGFAGAPQPEPTKIWSARQGPTTDGTLNPIRQTEPLPPLETAPESSGVWQFPNVALRKSYEIVFAKPGFNTQSFVVTPPDDGSPVELDVELKPAEGLIGGIVFGASGPLGGAEITVTDGTLTFTTTSATVGDVGTWSVDQVSTPGVYTVTAARRGYGTEVIQVPLTAGQKIGDTEIRMRPGVGSVSGRVVGLDGQPLGGVTITATNGDSSRSTSSLTEGDIGSYNIPQLDAPATYTLEVSAPDYLTQTRRLPVSGAVAGVDFSMTKTTLRLTGMVSSAGTGAGIPNAGLTLTTGNLTFRASTAVAPNQGGFEIDDLPPGNYTVKVEHYQHVTATQFITLTAGVTPPPLDLVLQPTDGLPAVGTGSLVVEVVDASGETAAEREIQNATVRLIRTQTGQELPSVTQQAFNFRIENIPIGTYTLLVTAPRYNPAPPRQVSIGLSEQRVEVQLLRLGQASGRVIDSLTEQPLLGYFVSLYRQPENPGDAPVFTIASGAGGLWQTPADSLIPGVYRVEITDAASPAGYTVRNDQVLDPLMPGTGSERFMRFVLPEGSLDPITVGDIEADPYPAITGRVYRPEVTGTDLTFQPIDSNALTVSMSCPGGVTTQATIADQAGVQGATPPLFDSFTITKEMVDAGNLVGDCTLAVGAGGGYVPLNVALPGVDASNGVSTADRRLHIALNPPPPTIGGSVFWLNGTTRVMLGAVDVTATRVVSVDPVVSAAAGDQPQAVETPGSDTSDSLGVWDLDGQIAGVATYEFAAANFAPGAMTITVADGTATATAGAGTVVTTTSGGRFDVQLAAPAPRTLEGTVTILTTDGSYAFNQLQISALSPTLQAIDESTPAGPGVTSIERTGTVGNVLSFRILNATPGTWQVDVTTPDNHISTSTLPVSQIVEPGSGSKTGFDATFAELATLRLTLANLAGTAVTTPPEVELTPDLPGVPTISATLTPVDDGPDNVFELAGISVDPTDPRFTRATYTISVEVDGFDTHRVSATIDAMPGEAPQPVNADSPLGDPRIDAEDMTGIGFYAGTVRDITLELPRLGTLSGEALGLVDFGPPLAYDDVNIETVGTFTVTPVDVLGNDLPPGAVDLDDLVVTRTGNDYSVTGPQGYYELVVTHPEFEAGTIPVDDLPAAADLVLPPSAVSGVFRIVNDFDNTPEPFALDVIPGSLDLAAYESLDATPRELVPGAEYTIRKGATVIRTGTMSSGAELIDGLLPGDYTLEVRDHDDISGEEIAFPVITDIRIERAVPDGSGVSVPSVTIVRAPLPPYRPEIIGKILGRNSNGDPVVLPGSAALYDVTSTFDEPAVEIDGTAVAQDPTAGDATAEISTAQAATGEVGYTFRNVPVGAHKVTIDPTPSGLTGYDLVGGVDAATQPITVIETGLNPGPDFVFRVPDVTLTLQLTTGDYPDRTKSVLTAPSGATYGFDGATNYLGTTTFDDDTDRITITGVAPEIGMFEFDFDDALHQEVVDAPVDVPPDTDGNAQFTASDTVDTVGNVARVSGDALQRDTGSVTSPLGAGGTVKLTSVVDSSDVHTFTVPAGTSAGSYQFDVAPGTYDLLTTRTDYTQQSREITVEAGVINDEDVEILKLATFAVTISNSPLPSDLSVVLLDDASTIYNPILPQTGNVFSFKMVPNVNYRIRARATGYADALDPTSGSVTAAIGSNTVRTLTLVPRTLTLTVNGGTPPAGTKVTAKIGATTVVDTVAPFEFRSTDASPIPLTGGGYLLVEATGYRTRKVDFEYQPTLALTTVIAPPLTVTGAINAPDAVIGDQVIRATSGADTIYGTITSGQYTIVGLDVGAEGADRAWTISYDKFKTGISTPSPVITVTSTSTNPATAVTVVAQTIQVTFNAKAGSTAAPGVIVNFNGASRTTPASGITTPSIGVLENVTNLNYTVTGDGYLVHPGGTVTLSSRAALEVPVAVTVRPPITGKVVNGGGNGINNATLRVCVPGPPPPPADTICQSGDALATGSSTNNAGDFSISTLVAPGTYKLWARQGGPGSPAASVTLTIADDRSYTLSSSTITIG